MCCGPVSDMIFSVLVNFDDLAQKNNMSASENLAQSSVRQPRNSSISDRTDSKLISQFFENISTSPSRKKEVPFELKAE